MKKLLLHYIIFISAAMAIVPEALAQTQTTTTLSGSAQSLMIGSPLTLQAVVAPAPSGGFVTFYDRTTVLGSAALDSSGHASFVTYGLLPLGHRLRAVYTGNAAFATSLSDYFVVTITSAASTGFINGSSIAIPNGGPFIVGADFNGDGMLDLAVARPHGVAVYFGKVMGEFQAPSNYDLPSAQNGIFGLAVADFRGTGRQDLVLSNGKNVYFLWNNGSGTFTFSDPVNIVASIIKVADFNRDGIPDLAFMGASGAGMNVYLGNGNGTFRQWTLALTKGDVPLAFDVADFDLDGKPDVVILMQNATPHTAAFGIMLNEGSGHLTNPTYTAVAFAVPVPSGILASDINRDGRPDVVSFTATQASVFLGNGQGGFGPNLPIDVNGPAGSIGSFVGGDFNGDGLPDLLVLGEPNAYALYGKGDGTFQPAATLSFPPFPWGAVAGDFNGDGRIDFALLSLNGNEESLQIMFGAKP